MKSLKTFVCLVFCLGPAAFLAACGGGGSGGGDQAPVFAPQGNTNVSRQGSLTLEIPAIGSGRTASLIPSNAQKMSVVLRLIQRKPGIPKLGEELMERNVTLGTQSQRTTVSGLDPGAWLVSMAALDGNGTVLTETSTPFFVKAAENTEVPLTLGLKLSGDGKSATNFQGPFNEGDLLTVRNVSASLVVGIGETELDCIFPLGVQGYVSCPLMGSRFKVAKLERDVAGMTTLLEGSVIKSASPPSPRPGIGVARGVLSPLQKADASGFVRSGSFSLDWGDGSPTSSGEDNKLFTHRFAQPGFYKLTVRGLDGSNTGINTATITVLEEDPLGSEFYFRPNEQISLFDAPDLDQLPPLLELKTSQGSSGLQLNALTNGLFLGIEGGSPGAGAELCPAASLGKSVLVQSSGQKICIRGPLGGFLIEITSFFPNLNSSDSCSTGDCPIYFGEVGVKRLQKLPALIPSGAGAS